MRGWSIAWLTITVILAIVVSIGLAWRSGKLASEGIRLPRWLQAMDYLSVAAGFAFLGMMMFASMMPGFDRNDVGRLDSPATRGVVVAASANRAADTVGLGLLLGCLAALVARDIGEKVYRKRARGVAPESGGLQSPR